jgi:hypothetical protein
MDFLEGFLLGPIWSDTEYETRHHVGFYWLVGWATLAVFAFLAIYPEKAPGWLNMPDYLPFVLFFLLALLSPFASRYYYRLNLLVKIGILLLQILKFGFGFIAFLQFWRARFVIDLAAVPQSAMDYVNKTIASSSNYFASLGEGTGMLVGIVSGGLLVVLTFAGGLLLATVLPAIYLLVMQLIQRGIDLLARATVIRSLD